MRLGDLFHFLVLLPTEIKSFNLNIEGFRAWFDGLLIDDDLA